MSHLQRSHGPLRSIARTMKLFVCASVLTLAVALSSSTVGSTHAYASAQNASSARVQPATKQGCSTLSGVTLNVGSTTLTTATNELGSKDENAALYGTGIAPGTNIITVSSPTSAIISNDPIVNESDVSLTVCTPGTGSITCTDVTGTMRFSPGLLIKARTVKEQLDLKITGCTTSQGTFASGSQVAPRVLHYDSWSSTVGGLTLNCSDFEVGTTYEESTVSPKGKVTWNAPISAPSNFKLGGFSLSAPNAQLMMTYPQAGGTATVRGAYGGTYAAISLIANPNQFIGTKCTSIAGLEAFQINEGTVTFGQPSS